MQEDGAEVIPMEEVVEYSAEDPHRDNSTDVPMEVLQEVSLSSKYNEIEETKSDLVQQYKAEKHQEENKSIIDFKESLKDELQFFSEAKLQAISEGKDCHLDDPELFTSKKHLMEKFTPLSVTHAISGKFPNSGITSSKSERKNPADGASMLFSHIVTSANGV